MSEKEFVHVKLEELFQLKTTINWRFLESGKGAQKIENVAQIIAGRIILWLGLVIEFGIVISEIVQNYYLRRLFDVSSFEAFVFWLILLITLFALYLLRDREWFTDRPHSKTLYQLIDKITAGKQKDDIELTDYLTHELIWVFDYVLNLEKVNYLGGLWQRILKMPKAQGLLFRLGLSADQFDIGILERASSMDDVKTTLREILVSSFEIAYRDQSKYISEEIITFVYIQKFFRDHLLQYNITDQDINGIGLWLTNEAKKRKYIEDWRNEISLKPKSAVNRAYTSRYAPTLYQYARDFTMEVIAGNFQISIARNRELDQLITSLEKGSKSAVLVIGEPGVGKTTLIKSLAVRMVVEDVPPKLKDMRLVGFDFNKAYTQSHHIDSFKEKLRAVFEEVAQSKNTVLVLDNINQLLNIRKELAGEIANIIVDSYESFSVRLIATTNRSQFVQYIRPTRALAAIFSTVEMAIPSDEVATQIVFDEVPGIEGEYRVKTSYAAVKASVELSHKIAHDRVLPDRAIDILKETVVKFKDYAGHRPIGYDEVAKTISDKVGISLGSISQDESAKLVRLEEEMHKRVIDQEEAIKAVAEALRRARSGLADDKKPIASFLFYGPTGVGKTEVAKTVAAVYYGSEERMARIDMSEYNEEENMARLIGYTSDQGAFEGGFLTEPIHENPFSLVLLDEIDKANPKVLDLFLQMLDEGYIYDGMGRKIDFANTIIIATSNAGSDVIAALLEKQKAYEEVTQSALEELKKVFRIEFLNRFSKIIMFKSLTRQHTKLIARKFVDQVKEKLHSKGILLEYDEGLLERLADMGYSPVFGAREMKRTVQEEVENKVANLIVSGEVKAGGTVRL